MARKHGRLRWFDRIDASLKEYIDAYIDSHTYSWAEIYSRLNLMRFCKPRTFRDYMTWRRRRADRRYERTRGEREEL